MNNKIWVIAKVLVITSILWFFLAMILSGFVTSFLIPLGPLLAPILFIVINLAVIILIAWGVKGLMHESTTEVSSSDAASASADNGAHSSRKMHTKEKILFWIKTLLISYVLFDFVVILTLFIPGFPFIVLGSSFVGQFFGVVIYVLIFCLLAWLVARRLHAKMMIVANGLEENNFMNYGADIWVITVYLLAFIIPTIPEDKMGGLVYLVVVPMLIVCIIIFLLLKNKFKHTNDVKYKKLLIWLLACWTILLTIIYSMAFLPYFINF